MRKSRILSLAALCCAAGWSADAGAQANSDRPHGHQHAMPANGSFGELSFPNSGNEAAQAPFLRGVKLLHNFQYEDAIAAFQQAQTSDPNFALAYWGEAMAHNYTLWSEQHTDQARAILARLGPTAEARSAKAKTVREKMWLGAVEALYGSGTKFERDEAYADRMDALHAAYPGDTEALVFDALATMGRSHGIRDTKAYLRAAAMLEPVFKANPQHPGATHYLIHAYDEPAFAERGLPMARVYNKVAPDSAHAQHMTSHIYLAMGMWPEVEQANVDAGDALVRRMGEPMRARMACGHGGIWLAYARLQQGKSVDSQLEQCAKVAADDIASVLSEGRQPWLSGSGEDSPGSAADIRVRRGVETGQWAERLALPPGRLNYARFVDDYGDVLAARHDAARAGEALRSLDASYEILTTAYKEQFPDDSQSLPWLDVARAEAAAVALLASDRHSEGMTALRAAAEREKALPAVFGPPMLQKPSWELLGDELLAGGDKAGAAAAYRESLKLQPGRRLSVAGLKAATAP
jgi:tetratricopeptide (TPR) repeat protein